jgi:hypothetical protein
MAAHFRYRESVNADGDERLFHGIEFGWLNYRF